MFLLVSVRHVGAHPGGHQHGVSIQISINLGKTFLRISRIRNILLAWILAKVFVYLPPFIFQIPDFIYWTVFIFLFWSILNGVTLKTSNWLDQKVFFSDDRSGILWRSLLVLGPPFNSWWGGGGGGFWKKISCKRLSKEKNCMQHKCNRQLMGKKGKKYPAHQIARKNFFEDQKAPMSPPPRPPPPSRSTWSSTYMSCCTNCYVIVGFHFRYDVWILK